MKIGVVNIGTLLDESKRGQALSTRLRTIASQWEEKLQVIRANLGQLDGKLEKTPNSAKPEVKMKLLREQELAQMEYRQTEERMRVDIESQRQQFRAQLLSEAQPHLREVAQNEGLGVILNSPHPSLSYISPEVDITQSVIELLNRPP